MKYNHKQVEPIGDEFLAKYLWHYSEFHNNIGKNKGAGTGTTFKNG